MPGSRFGTAYPPVSAVTTVRVKPVLCDVTVMVAPGSPRLLASTTRPLMDACCWAKAGTAMRHSAATQRTREARHMKEPPKWEAWRVGYWEGYRVRSVFAGSGCCKRGRCRCNRTSGVYQLMHYCQRHPFDHDSGRDNGAASPDLGRTHH